MRKFLYPQLSRGELGSTVICAIATAILAALYGVIHDQITYTISPEYFTKFKFQQFRYDAFQFGPRILASAIGVLATWWVGLFVGWCVGRRFIFAKDQRGAYRNVAFALVIVLLTSILFSIGGFVVSYTADAANWVQTLNLLGVHDQAQFITVAYIHNASYLGGLVGLIVAVTFVRNNKSGWAD